MQFPPTLRKNATEQEAIERLIKAAQNLAESARWNNLGMRKVNELRAPLIELKRARRAKSNAR